MRCRPLTPDQCVQNKSFCDEALPTSVTLPATHSTPASGFVLNAGLSYSVALLRVWRWYSTLEFVTEVCWGSVITVPVALVTYNHAPCVSFSDTRELQRLTRMHAMHPKHTHTHTCVVSVVWKWATILQQIVWACLEDSDHDKGS